MEEEEREEVLYHGTTLDVAQKILSKKAFEARETYFSSTKELALYFAQRSSLKQSENHKPAILRLALYSSDLQNWIRNKQVKSSGFDESDKTELYGKTQLIFSAEGIRFLNTYSFKDEWRLEPIK